MTRHQYASKHGEQRASTTAEQTSQFTEGSVQHCQTKGNKDLSVDILYASSRTGIPTLVLKHMWSKAAE